MLTTLSRKVNLRREKDDKLVTIPKFIEKSYFKGSYLLLSSAITLRITPLTSIKQTRLCYTCIYCVTDLNPLNLRGSQRLTFVKFSNRTRSLLAPPLRTLSFSAATSSSRPSTGSLDTCVRLKRTHRYKL